MHFAHHCELAYVRTSHSKAASREHKNQDILLLTGVRSSQHHPGAWPHPSTGPLVEVAEQLYCSLLMKEIYRQNSDMYGVAVK